MQFDTFKKIIDETALENPDARIWLAIMGEPLILGEKIADYVRYAKDCGIREVCLNTNAVFLTPNISGKLIDSGVDKVIVSIDGFSAATYDRIRIGGNYELVINNVEAFLELKTFRHSGLPEIVAQFIVMEENEHEIEPFKNYWLSKGATVKIRPKLGWGNAVHSTMLDDIAGDTERFPCSWLTRTVSIHWDGSFSQCDADYEGGYSPGHLDQNTIKEVWEGALAERRKRHWDGDFSFEPCDTCKDWLAGRSFFYYPEGNKQ